MGTIEFISAGAGSGKTYTLAQRLDAELSSGRVRPGGVLATTFTKKAATELRERVRGHLIDRQAFGLANAIGQARIGTVNAVCAALLQRFAFEAGLPPEQQVLDEAGAEQLLREAVDEVVESTHLEELLDAATRLELLELPRAGPPPWRTTLTQIVSDARANAIDADRLRAMGSINAAGLAAHLSAPTKVDLDRRLRSALTAVLPQLQAAVANGGANKTAMYQARVERALQALQTGSLNWSQWNALSSEEPQASLRAAVAPVKAVAARHREHPRLRADLQQYLQRLFALAGDTLDAYARRKRELGAVDFADQERLLLDILDQDSVAQTLRDELDLLMVDEFQDTSPIQLALFLRLAGFAQRTVWVGDIKQAIYGFRGSDAQLMRSVVDALPAMGGTKDVLPYSFRSRPSLVSLVNEVFGRAFAGIKPADVALAPKRKELRGTAALEDWILAGKNKGAIQQSLVAGIRGLVAQGVKVTDPRTNVTRALRYADIAILARSNDNVQDIAAALGASRIPSLTSQPGLLSQPEAVLALACLRRLDNEEDTVATAEIVSLGDCEEPEVWLADRLAWIQAGGSYRHWKEGLVGDAGTNTAAHPVLAALRELRARAELMSPSELVALVLARCKIALRVLQWSRNPDLARRRLANLDRLQALVAQYEDEAPAARQAATLSGFLIWLQRLEAEGKDALAVPAVDAVQVLTYHTAKGLEWPVVVLTDLAGEVKDRVWDLQARSGKAFDATAPLSDRYLHYWPWPYGAQDKADLDGLVRGCPEGARAITEAVEEHKRLLYVAMTRARDVLVVARAAKTPDGPWMATVGLAQFLERARNAKTILPLDRAGTGAIGLADGVVVPFRRQILEPDEAVAQDEVEGSLSWFTAATTQTARPSLFVSPSFAVGGDAQVLEFVRFGEAVDTSATSDRATLGAAIHACLAVDLAVPGQRLTVEQIEQILVRLGASAMLTSADTQTVLTAFCGWLRGRWPGAQIVVEAPIEQPLPGGQILSGRTDLLLRINEPPSWVLLDHKSTEIADVVTARAVAGQYVGQLRAYRDAITTATGLPVAETWLSFPLAGCAARIGLQS